MFMYENTPKDYTIKDITIFPSDVRDFIPTVRNNGQAIHDYNYLFYVFEGEFIYYIDGKSHIVRPHQIALIPKGKPTFLFTTFSNNFRAKQSYLSSKINGENFFDFFELTTDDYVITISNYKRLEECLERSLHDPDFSDSASYNLNRIAAMSEIMAIYLENRQRRIKNIFLWNPVVSYMKENLDKNFSIETLADIVFLHPNYFIQKFKKSFGISPMKFYNDLRIERAIQLLSETNVMPTADIAAAIGIVDANYFSYFFKTNCGLSPKEYRSLFLKMNGVIDEI